ncbi:hypothetical protein [Microbacterium radiodurans]|uniref:Uncharacterized protein n=1 Tax=Microbacterium radiodurans TaxID=661398 RepID=A0A5J5ITR6_9MICO|nr:hypothetical protein [Microbacterium radiodurans]KAA9085409.1 hypothetical protein F6B42_13160 [Microbacterium radiodurans]
MTRSSRATRLGWVALAVAVVLLCIICSSAVSIARQPDCVAGLAVTLLPPLATCGAPTAVQAAGGWICAAAVYGGTLFAVIVGVVSLVRRSRAHRSALGIVAPLVLLSGLVCLSIERQNGGLGLLYASVGSASALVIGSLLATIRAARLAHSSPDLVEAR